MRKIYLITFLTIALLLVFGFRVNDNKHDSKLVGIWKGFEKDKQIEGVEKHWIQERFKDGTYIIMFTVLENCEVKTFTEKGNWWTEKGKFYEVTDGTEDIDSYNYEVVDNLVVQFKSIKLTGEDNTNYEFMDYKID